MATLYDKITPEISAFIAKQQMFFVATAPSSGGSINMSPKGLDSFVVLGPNEVAWLDLMGSGVETLAHLKDDGRITMMFCGFTGAPNIVRLYGTGEAVRPGDPQFDELRAHFGDFNAVRSVVRVDVTRTSDSCGFGVPLMEFKGDRRALIAWGDKKTPDELAAYERKKLATSIDGLPGITDHA